MSKIEVEEDVKTDPKATEHTLPKRTKFYSFTISPYIFHKLEKLLYLIKAVGVRRTKKSWLLEAFHEKLKNEETEEIVPIERRLSVEIDAITSKKIDKRVVLLKKYRTSYSIKQWILEALLEKLDNDYKWVYEQLKNISNENEKK